MKRQAATFLVTFTLCLSAETHPLGESFYEAAVACERVGGGSLDQCGVLAGKGTGYTRARMAVARFYDQRTRFIASCPDRLGECQDRAIWLIESALYQHGLTSEIGELPRADARR